MNKPNNTPEQKAAWQKNKKLGSRFIKATPASMYRPKKKAPSRRDRHRMEGGRKILAAYRT